MNFNLKKIFFGWWMVIGGGIISLIGTGIFALGFSVFFKPMASELSLSRSVTSIAPSIQMAMGGVLGPLGGLISDKYGPRVVMLIGIVPLVLGSILMFFVNSTWSFLVVWGLLIGIGYSLAVTSMTDRAIINWFVKKSGVAINTKFAIQSFSGILMLPLIALMVENQGWRLTMMYSGIIVAVIVLPLIWFLMKPHPPEYYGMHPDGVTKPEDKQIDTNPITPIDEVNADSENFTPKEAMKTLSFWMLILIQLGFMLVAPMVGAHAVPFLTDKNIDLVQAASIMGLMQTTSIPSRIVTGIIMDRIKLINLRFLMAIGYVVQTAGVIMYIIFDSIASIYIWFICFGIGMGIAQSITFPLQARYFGRKYFGTITGVLGIITMPALLAGPIFVGWVYDTSGSYDNVIYLMVVMMILTTIACCFLIPPKKTKPIS